MSKLLYWLVGLETFTRYSSRAKLYRRCAIVFIFQNFELRFSRGRRLWATCVTNAQTLPTHSWKETFPIYDLFDT